MSEEAVAEIAGQLAQLVASEGICELTVEAGDHSLRLRRKLVVQAAPEPSPGGASGEGSVEAVSGEFEEETEVLAVTSTVVGVFHSASTLGGDPLVAAGESVSQGQLLGFVESMSLNHEVHSPHKGVLLEVLAGDGEPVEYGQALMLVAAD